MTTNEYIRSVKQPGWVPFPSKLWQRNYDEHVVRNEKELTRIRENIKNNPPNGVQTKIIHLQLVHVRDSLMKNEREIDWQGLNVLGRLSGNRYCEVQSIIESETN